MRGKIRDEANQLWCDHAGFPRRQYTSAYGIDESGTVVSRWDLLDSNGNTLIVHGFTWENGSFADVDFPGSGDTYLFGINARGDLVGGWDPGITSPLEHGFVCLKGQCSSSDVPVAGATQADDINANGQIAGAYVDVYGGNTRISFSRTNFSSFDFPGATSSLAWGINSAGQIVGVYRNAHGIPQEVDAFRVHARLLALKRRATGD